VSYPSLRRFIINRNCRRRSKITVRMADTPPGEVAEADFGWLGMITDPATGQRKAVWVMVIVLGHSCHCFVWPIQQQKLLDVIAGLEAAWAFFGGIPKYLVIDNCPAAMVGTDPLNPILTRGFLEYAQHRGFSRLPAATEGATHRTTDRDLGQFASPSWRRATSLPHHVWLEPVLGQPAQLQSRLQC
jgi:transposase